MALRWCVGGNCRNRADGKELNRRWGHAPTVCVEWRSERLALLHWFGRNGWSQCAVDNSLLQEFPFDRFAGKHIILTLSADACDQWSGVTVPSPAPPLAYHLDTSLNVPPILAQNITYGLSLSALWVRCMDSGLRGLCSGNRLLWSSITLLTASISWSVNQQSIAENTDPISAETSAHSNRLLHSSAIAVIERSLPLMKSAFNSSSIDAYEVCDVFGCEPSLMGSIFITVPLLVILFISMCIHKQSNASANRKTLRVYVLFYNLFSMSVKVRHLMQQSFAVFPTPSLFGGHPMRSHPMPSHAIPYDPMPSYRMRANIDRRSHPSVSEWLGFPPKNCCFFARSLHQWSKACFRWLWV